MTSTRPHIDAAQAASRAVSELSAQLDAKSTRRATIARDQANALRTIAKLKTQIQSDGVEAVLAGVAYEPAPDLARQLRKATDKAAPCDAALSQLDIDIAALRSDIDAATRARTMAIFGYSWAKQRDYAEDFKADLLALIPQLASLIAIDTFRARHATGAMSGVPAGGDRPWQSTAVILNFLKAIPHQLRPADLTLEVLQRAALTHVTQIEAALNQEQDQ